MIRFALLLSLIAAPAFAQEKPMPVTDDINQFVEGLNKPGAHNPDGLSYEQTQLIHQVEIYLNSLTTVVSDFIQVAPDGTISEGKFFMKRPGKLRWQYNPPVPILITAKDGRLTYYDIELDQISYSSTSATPMAVLSRKHIQFLNNKEFTIEGVEKSNANIRLTVSAKNSDQGGKLTLIFTPAPLELKQMEVVNLAGDTTKVTFNNSLYGKALEDELFIIKNPRLFNKRRN